MTSALALCLVVGSWRCLKRALWTVAADTLLWSTLADLLICTALTVGLSILGSLLWNTKRVALLDLSKTSGLVVNVQDLLLACGVEVDKLLSSWCAGSLFVANEMLAIAVLTIDVDYLL